jgi:hypothetical protein
VSESTINWNSMLRQISREFDAIKSESTPGAARRAREAARDAARDTGRDSGRRARQQAQGAELGVLVRLLLVLSLAVGVLYWPYPAQCGLDWLSYISAVAMVGTGGLWSTALTWRHRMAKTHTLSLLVVLWSLAVAAAQLLPRVGYASGGQLHELRWECTASGR